MDELIADTSLEDVGESCRPLVEMIGQVPWKLFRP